MRRLSMILVVLTLGLALGGNPVLANGHGMGPVIPSGTPNWAAIPGVPGVQYAPNVQADLFRHGGTYYCQSGGRWYRGQAVNGPWAVVQGPPPVFHRIEASYFKVSPGWARGKKTGWPGASMPPGQMKKYGCTGGHLPPGQMIKMAP